MRDYTKIEAWRLAEGSSRGTQRDYLHFLYIARGSLSETQYFVHLANRLGFFTAKEAEELRAQTKRAFACLHGLIKAVEKEAGVLTRIAATATSMLALCIARISAVPGA